MSGLKISEMGFVDFLVNLVDIKSFIQLFSEPHRQKSKITKVKIEPCLAKPKT